MSPGRAPLPVDGILDRLTAALHDPGIVVLEAPPGTGKTTRVPPAMLDAEWATGRILMLEPRRVAARAAAERIAAERDERVGEVVGLRTRFDTRTSDRTRLEVVTEGVLTRMLIDDPALRGVDAVVFDEFHERSIHADTSLAFVRETLGVLRDDLRIVVMSATLDAEHLATRLGAHATIGLDVPIHPVTTIYRVPAPGRTPEEEVPDAVLHALRNHDGDVLVFLAGAADIRRAQTALDDRVDPSVVITPLHGSLPAREQDRALLADPGGRRKIILATPIAETSVTIDGVRVVIDTGRRRRPEIDLGRGMSRLVTVTASQAATEQRRGRAGRQAPGVCIRLWPEVDQARRRVDEPPEILTADLTSLALDVAAWGAADAAELPWIDPPPTPALAAALGTLTALGAIDDQRRLTAHGRSMAGLGTEPRLAHLILCGVALDMTATACDVAALLSDPDPPTGVDRPCDLRPRLDALHGGGGSQRAAGRRRAMRLAQRWRRHFRATDDPPRPDLVGPLVSLAHPGWIAQRRQEPGSFLLASGTGASLPTGDALAREPYLAVAETAGSGPDARIVAAAPLTLEEIERFHGPAIESSVRGGWDRRRRDVVFERQRRLGSLILQREPDPDPDRDAVVQALLTGIRREGLDLLGWTAADRRWRERAQFLHRARPDAWPSFGDEELLADLEEWLAPHLAGARRRADLERIDVRKALETRLDWRQNRELDALAPTHIVVPSGSRIPVDYGAEPGPALAVRLQEVFGLRESPTIVDGTITVVLHLLSPAHRPVQVTTDLSSFWSSGYAEVRKELRGRYPRHQWPEDPTTAAPTARAKRRGDLS